jgi:hypothetical protein
MRIACLHTAESNVAVFDSAAKALGMAPNFLQHEVRADLLSAAEHARGLTTDIANATQQALLSLAQQADAVVLTCSTLGPSIEGISTYALPTVMRADEALACAAVRACPAGRRIVVLCAVETTLGSTALIFQQAAAAFDTAVEVRLVTGAWALFKKGDLRGYSAMISSAADQAYIEGASVVALGQASMSDAAPLVTAGPPPLTSATEGLRAALKAATHHDASPLGDSGTSKLPNRKGDGFTSLL